MNQAFLPQPMVKTNESVDDLIMVAQSAISASGIYPSNSDEIMNLSRRLTLALSASDTGVWEYHILDGTLIWDHQMYRLYGISEESFSGAYHAWEQGLHPDDLEQARKDSQDAISGERKYDTVFRVVWPSGEIRHIRALADVYRDSAGVATHMYGVNFDITYRVKAEMEIKRANAELEEFAYRTSHDLRSPLVSSISLLDMAEHAIRSDDKETALVSLSHIQNSLGKLNVLVTDILLLTRTKNEVEADQAIDVSALIDESLSKLDHMENFGRLEKQKDLRFSGTLATKKYRFALIVENLVSNAVKYQDLDKDNSFMKISTRKQDNNFVLEIQDNGLGIPVNQQENLFKMFKRFHPRTSFGSGLGLYMMNKSADILGGRICFEDPGNGSIFRLEIPLAD